MKSILISAILGVLIIYSHCQPDYSQVFIDFSPFPFPKPNLKELMGEKNITLQSRIIEEIRMKSSLQYTQIQKTSMRFGMESFDGLETIQFCLLKPQPYGVQRMKTLFPLPNKDDKYSQVKLRDEICLTFSSYKKGLFESMQTHVTRYMRQPLFANLGDVISSGVWRFQGLYTVDLQYVMLLKNAKLSRTNRNKHLNPSISFYFTTDTHVRTLSVSRFKPQISELVEVTQFQRVIDRNGFHAQSNYTFQLKKKEIVPSEFQQIPLDLQKCRIAILEQLTSIQYVSQSQLQKQNVSFFSDKIDIESNEQDAPQYTIGFQIPIEELETKNSDILRGSFKIPMHLRYPTSKSVQVNEGYSKFNLNPALLYLSCQQFQMKYLQKTSKDSSNTGRVKRLGQLFDKASFMSKLIFWRSQSIFEYLSISRDDLSEVTLPHVIKEHAQTGFPLTIFFYVIMLSFFLLIVSSTFKKLLGSKKYQHSQSLENQRKQILIEKKKDD